MKVFIHIKNDSFFCHPAISVVADLPEAPQVGDCVYLQNAHELMLEEDIEIYTRKEYRERGEDCSPDYFECCDKTGCNLEEYIYCVGRAFHPVEDDIRRYELHIELGKYEHLKSARK